MTESISSLVGSSTFFALWLLASPGVGMQASVLSEQKISDTTGGLGGVLTNGDEFGYAADALGDLDGDGIVDLAVSTRNDNDGGTDRGSLWILFMNTDGTVASKQKISDTAGGFTGTLDDNDTFGSALAGLGDLDGDGVEDLAVGARFDDDGGVNRGAAWILFLNANGTVKSHQKISDTAGGFTGLLDDSDQFGTSLAALGDLDGDGVVDLAVGANLDDDGGVNRGAVWILFLDNDGTVKSHQKISDAAGGFSGALDVVDQFGASLASLGDLDHDGSADLAVGAVGDNDGGEDQGAVWILFLDADGTVKTQQKISDFHGNFAGTLDDFDQFGSSLETCDDIDDDGRPELAVGAIGDDDGGVDQGATWLLFLKADGTVSSERKISATSGGFGGDLDTLDNFGISGVALGDLDGNGIEDLGVGAHRDDDGGSSAGALWVLFMGRDPDPPVILCSEDIIAEPTGPGGAVVTYAVTAVDETDPAPTLVCTPEPGSIFPPGTTMVTVTATDTSGNFSTCTFGVTVADTTPPVITCPSDIVKRTKVAGGCFVSFAPSASDLFDPTPTTVSVPPSGSFFPIGTTTVSVTATDDAGNASTCSFDVVIERKARLFGPPLSIAVLTTPFELPMPSVTDDAHGPRTEHGERAETSEWLDFTLPPGEPLLLLDVASARVDVTDGVVSHVLYEYEPGDEELSLSVFADLALLFPHATGETVLRLTGAKNLRFHGGSSLRNGSGVNEVSFFSACTPRAGAEWQAWVDVSAHPDARASIVMVSARPLTGRPSPFGEILIDVLSRRPLFTSTRPSGGATDVHAFPIPAEVLGLSFSLQGLILGPSRNALTNAVDITVRADA